MKNLILIIVFLLLCPSLVLAEQERPTFSKHWQSFTINEKNLYLRAHNVGEINIFIAVKALMPEPLDKSLSDKLWQLYTEMHINFDVIGVTVLSNVVSELYNDPANAYVAIGEMARIARDKIQGKSVDDKLLKARREAQISYESYQDFLKNK